MGPSDKISTKSTCAPRIMHGKRRPGDASAHVLGLIAFVRAELGEAEWGRIGAIARENGATEAEING